MSDNLFKKCQTIGAFGHYFSVGASNIKKDIRCDKKIVSDGTKKTFIQDTKTVNFAHFD